MIEIKFAEAAFGETLLFETPDQALLHAQDQIKAWRRRLRIADAIPGPNESQSHTAYLAPLRAWEGVAEEIDRLRQRKLADTFDDVIDARGLVLSQSEFADALFWVAENMGRNQAHFAALSYGLSEGNIDWSNADALFGILGLDWAFRRAHEYGIESGLSAKWAILEKGIERATYFLSVAENAQKRLDQTIESAVEQAGRHEAIEAVDHVSARAKWTTLREEADTIKSQISDQLSKQSKSIKDSIDNANATIQQWIAAQDEKRQLAAPAQLWLDRAKSHNKKSIIFGSMAAVCGSIGLICSFVIAEKSFLFAQDLFSTALIGDNTSKSAVNQTRLNPTFTYQLIFSAAVTLAWLTIYLWAMKIIVRLYTTEHHLAIDASSRSAMNDTYLGLIEAGAADKNDRAIVLSALFRPVQDGIVKDDGPPLISPAAIVSGAVLGTTKA